MNRTGRRENRTTSRLASRYRLSPPSRGVAEWGVGSCGSCACCSPSPGSPQVPHRRHRGRDPHRRAEKLESDPTHFLMICFSDKCVICILMNSVLMNLGLMNSVGIFLERRGIRTWRGVKSHWGLQAPLSLVPFLLLDPLCCFISENSPCVFRKPSKHSYIVSCGTEKPCITIKIHFVRRGDLILCH